MRGLLIRIVTMMTAILSADGHQHDEDEVASASDHYDAQINGLAVICVFNLILVMIHHCHHDDDDDDDNRHHSMIISSSTSSYHMRW